METLKIQRTVNGRAYRFSLSHEEMEQAYRMKQRSYLEADFMTTLEDPAEGTDYPVTYEQLELYPQNLAWLCEQYGYFFDANMSHNDLIELAFHQLKVKLRDSGSSGISGFAGSLICKEVS